MVSNTEFQIKYLSIQELVTLLVLRGISDGKHIVEVIDKEFKFNSEYEQELISELILDTKFSILN